MSAAAGVAATAQPLMCVAQIGDQQPVVQPRFAYAGNDALSFLWGQTAYQSADTRPVSDGAWHHVAVVFNQNYVTFYKDGVAAADVFQMPASETSQGLFQIGAAADTMPAFNGELYDVRVWNTARTPAQISSYRYVTLTGTEPGLRALFNLSGVNPALPVTLVNQVTNQHAVLAGNAAVVPAVLPQQPLPASVWTYPIPGESPAGPLLSPQGLLCTDNDTGGTGGAFLRSVELENGQVQWSYDVRQQSELTSVIIPAAVGSDGQTAYTGVQSPYQGTTLNFVEIHAVNVATGEPAWPQPAHLATATAFTTRPIVLGGTLYAGVHGVSGGGLAWGDPASGTMQVKFFSRRGAAGRAAAVHDRARHRRDQRLHRPERGGNRGRGRRNPGQRARSRSAAMGDHLAGETGCRHHRGPGAGLIDAVHPHRGDDRRAEHRRRVDAMVASAQRVCGPGPPGGDRQHAVRRQHRRDLVRAGHRDRHRAVAGGHRIGDRHRPGERGFGAVLRRRRGRHRYRAGVRGGGCEQPGKRRARLPGPGR